MIENILQNGILPDNICTLLNTEQISKSAINSFVKETKKLSKELADEYYQQQTDHTTQEQLGTAKDIVNVGADFAYNTVAKGQNQEIVNRLSRKYSAEKNNSKIDYDKKLEVVIREVLCGEGDIKKINDIKPEYKSMFTTDEQNRILGKGQYTDKYNLFDYKLGQSTDDDIIMDNIILNKIVSSNKVGLEQFKIVDNTGVQLDFKHYNEGVLKMFLVAEGTTDWVGEKNKLSLSSFKAIAEVSDTQKKLLKLHHNNGLKNLTKKVMGVDTMKQSFKEYTDQTKSIKTGAKGIKVIDKVNTTAYKVGKGVKNKIDNKSLEKLVKNKDWKKAQALKKKMNSRNQKLAKLESISDKIRHPFSSLAQGVVGKVKSTKTVSKIRSLSSKNRILKSISERFKHVKIGVNTVIGKLTLPFRIIWLQLIKVLVPVLGICVLLMVVVMVICSLFMTSIQSNQAVMIFPLSEQSDFDSYQKKYDELDDNFLKNLESSTNNFAQTTNLKGEQIVYGVNGQNNEEGMENEDYENGLYYKFLTDKDHDGRSSNIEDLICIMAIMFQQNQTTYRDASLRVLEWLYNISHTYTTQESPLYACDSACHNIEYKCTDKYNEYKNNDIKYEPFHALKRDGGEYEIIEPPLKCEVCSQFFDTTKEIPEWNNGGFSSDCMVISSGEHIPENCYGCVSRTKCFHGEGANMGRDKGRCRSVCSSFSAVYECPGHEHSDGEGNSYVSYCEGELGCEGYYSCNGHSHYSCDGHNYKCCMGHVDVQMNVNIKFANEIQNLIDDIDFGENDKLARYNEKMKLEKVYSD